MRRDVEPSDQMKQPHKREREYDPETTELTPKHRPSEISPPALPPAKHEVLLLTTPVRSAVSPKKHVDPSSQRPQTPSQPTPKAHKQSSKALSEQARPKRKLDGPYCDPPTPKHRRRSAPAPERQPVELQPAKPQQNWFVDYWLSKFAEAPAVQETLEGFDCAPFGVVESNDIIPAIEGLCDWEDEERDQMSQSQLQDAGGSQARSSTVSEKLKTSSPVYRASLKMNKVIVDDHGIEMPREVEEMVTRHIRKERTSPRLGDNEKASILRGIRLLWNHPEWEVTEKMVFPLLPFGDLTHAPSLAQGGDVLWSRTPLPQNVNYPLVTPKTDKHLGYQTSLMSQWTLEELTAADHPRVRPYSQPTQWNIFPSFLSEAKSEATGGTPYAAEAQLATAGFHRVKSMIWTLDQIDPKRTRKSSDAIVFSAVYTQRQVIAHVHYYDPDSDTFRMSFVDSFYLAKEVQGCVDFCKNIEEWLVEIQQPVVREAMRRMYPITQLWNKGRLASAVTDNVNSLVSDSGRSGKNMRTE